MNEQAIILVTFASIVLAACTTGVKTESAPLAPAPQPAISSPKPALPLRSEQDELERGRVACTADVKRCSDGSFVSRDPAQQCAFRACPASK